MRAGLLSLLLIILPLTSSLAQSPTGPQINEALEKRAHALAQQIRCLVCQGQSIDDSDADLAHDLNRLIREKIAAGWTDAEILSFLEARYGPFILFKPPLRWDTAPLWLSPVFLLALCGIWVFLRSRRKGGR